MKKAAWPFALLLLGALWGQDPNKEMQKSLKDTDIHASWIYNDIDAGFAEAKKSGRPLLVVFR